MEGAEGDRESQADWAPEIMTWEGSKSGMLNGLSHPGSPIPSFLNFPSSLSPCTQAIPCPFIFHVFLREISKIGMPSCNQKGEHRKFFQKRKVPPFAPWVSLQASQAWPFHQKCLVQTSLPPKKAITKTQATCLQEGVPKKFRKEGQHP